MSATCDVADAGLIPSQLIPWTASRQNIRDGTLSWKVLCSSCWAII